MPRTVTREWQSFRRPNVKYTFSKTEPHITTITIPPGSDWTSELHWHETHREFLSIVSGSALVTVGNITRTCSAKDGHITIERGVLHEWKRDTANDEVLVVQEWTDPADGMKELFFRNLCSALIDIGGGNVRPPLGMKVDWYIMLQLFVIFSAYDNYPILYHGSGFKLVTKAVLIGANIMGWLLGTRPSYLEYVIKSSKETKNQTKNN